MEFDNFFRYFMGGILILILLMMVLAFFVGIPMSIYYSLEKECYKPKSLELISVNGMKDSNTGFLSGGTIREKTLLFENGLIITKHSNYFDDLELRIGKEYEIKKCITNGGSFNYEISVKRRKAK